MQWANPAARRGEYYLPTIQPSAVRTIQTRYELPIILQELQLHVGLELGVTRYELAIILQELQLHVGLELGVQAGYNDFALFLLQNWPQCRRYYLVDPWTPIKNYKVGTVTCRNLAYCRIGRTSIRASRAISSWRLSDSNFSLILEKPKLDKNFFLILGKPSFCAWPATKHSIMYVMKNSISSTSTPAMITVPRRMISLVGYWLINKSIDRVVAQGASRWSLRRPRLQLARACGARTRLDGKFMAPLNLTRSSYARTVATSRVPWRGPSTNLRGKWTWSLCSPTGNRSPVVGWLENRFDFDFCIKSITNSLMVIENMNIHLPMKNNRASQENERFVEKNVLHAADDKKFLTCWATATWTMPTNSPNCSCSTFDFSCDCRPIYFEMSIRVLAISVVQMSAQYVHHVLTAEQLTSSLVIIVVFSTVHM